MAKGVNRQLILLIVAQKCGFVKRVTMLKRKQFVNETLPPLGGKAKS
jgi:hypothetical protein